MPILKVRPQNVTQRIAEEVTIDLGSQDINLIYEALETELKRTTRLFEKERKLAVDKLVKGTFTDYTEEYEALYRRQSLLSYLKSDFAKVHGDIESRPTRVE